MEDVLPYVAQELHVLVMCTQLYQVLQVNLSTLCLENLPNNKNNSTLKTVNFISYLPTLTLHMDSSCEEICESLLNF